MLCFFSLDCSGLSSVASLVAWSLSDDDDEDSEERNEDDGVRTLIMEIFPMAPPFIRSDPLLPIGPIPLLDSKSFCEFSVVAASDGVGPVIGGINDSRDGGGETGVGVGVGVSCLSSCLRADNTWSAPAGSIDEIGSTEGSFVRGDVGGVLLGGIGFEFVVLCAPNCRSGTTAPDSACASLGAAPALSVAPAAVESTALLPARGDFMALFFMDWNDAGVNLPLS